MDKQNKILIIIIIFLIIGVVSAKTGNTIIGDSITNALNISAERGDFNSLYINSIGKKDTNDSYGFNINLLSPLKHIIGTSENQLDLGNELNRHFYLSSTDVNSVVSFHGSGESKEAIISIDNSFLKEYKFNQSEFNLGGANITGCSNCGQLKYAEYMITDVTAGSKTKLILPAGTIIEAFISSTEPGNISIDFWKTGWGNSTPTSTDRIGWINMTGKYSEILTDFSNYTTTNIQNRDMLIANVSNINGIKNVTFGLTIRS